MAVAVLLAGDRVASKPIQDDNKAFLTFRGEPMFVHVLRTLVSAKQVESVVVVGPRERLLDALERVGGIGDGPGVTVAEQGTNLVENALIGYLSSIDVGFPVRANTEMIYRRFYELVGSDHRETPALFVSCDIPIATGFEIDEFVANADMERFDYAIGMTDESVMETYYPTQTHPGIRMSYFHLAESRCRQNNMHLGKPLKVTAMFSIERMYELRYQRKTANIFKLMWHVVSKRITNFATLKYISLLQLARTVGDRKQGKLYDWIRSKNKLDRVMAAISFTLGLRVQAVFTRYGGAVLDVDNADDLKIIDAMYDSWIEHQKRIFETT